MRIPSNLTSLVDEGLIDEVVRPLMSGKEAEVFLVWSGGQLRVAKVYKEAQNRTFKNRAAYTEGRKVRNSRDQRAMDKRSRHGRAQDEAAWRSTEVDMIYRLQSAGVRVPVPYHSIDGVLVMEMVADGDGNPAPRLAETSLDRDQATWVFNRLLGEVVRMLCAGVVHGDLSDFNVLMGADGPVIIDFPQSVDAAQNQNARKLLLRDVDNLYRFLSRFVPDQRRPAFAEEMWELYANSALTPETRLTGRYRAAERRVDTRAVLDLIGDANYDERKRRERQGISMRGAPTQAQAPAPPPPDTRNDEPRARPQHANRPDHAGPHAANGTGPRPEQRAQAPRPAAPVAMGETPKPPAQPVVQTAPEQPRFDAPQRPHQHADQGPPQRHQQPREHRSRQPRYDAPQAASEQRPEQPRHDAPQRHPQQADHRPQQARHDAPQRQHAPHDGPPQRPQQHADHRPQQHADHRPQEPRYDTFQRPRRAVDNGAPQGHAQHAEHRPREARNDGPPQRHQQHADNGPPQRHQQHADQRPREPRYDAPQRQHQQADQRPREPRNDAPQRHYQQAGNGPPQRHPHAESHAVSRPPHAPQEPQRQPQHAAPRAEEAPQPAPRRRVVISVSTNERRPGSRRTT